MKLNENLVKLPTMTPTPPMGAFHAIGLIAVSWGEFENFFDRTLGGLLAAGGVQEEGWKHRNYRKRRALFRTTAATVLSAHPALHDYYGKVLQQSVRPHLHRNLIVHGRCYTEVRVTGAGTPPDVAVVFEGDVRGKVVRRKFTLDDMEALAYEILHLSGRLKTFSREDVEAPSLSLSDKSFALEIWNKGPPSAPMPAMT